MKYGQGAYTDGAIEMRNKCAIAALNYRPKLGSFDGDGTPPLEIHIDRDGNLRVLQSERLVAYYPAGEFKGVTSGVVE